MTKERNSSKPSLNTAQEPNSFFSEWERLRGLVNQFSTRAGQADELMQAINSLSFAVKNKDKLKELISALSKLNQSQLKKNTTPKSNPGQEKNTTPKSNSGQGKDKSAPNLTGDNFYDLVNSPAMTEIVREVMKTKKKRW
jgi:hypothetical protein